ncbi:L-aspartate oxidase [Brachybacterium horti]
MTTPGALHADVLVVGSGIAALTAALEIGGDADVLLVTKGALAAGATLHAQGGIAAAVGPGDTAADHARDTLAAGAGLAEEAAVHLLCEEGPAAIARLVERGVAFDRDEDGAPALGLEGAHGRPRILHAGGDATGRAIELALVAAVRERGIRVLERTALADLVVHDGRVRGARLLGADGLSVPVRAGAVLLATGGAGQLFAHTTNPQVATGDGVAAAARAGAALADLELYQFHPTSLAVPGGFLVSEAVRGEGAVLRDADGRRFLPAVDPRAELAPRDVVARAIARTMAAQGGLPVRLDATGIGGDRLRERFPTIDAAVRAAGLDWGRSPIPVTPAAHYWMGGIRTDLDGRTSLPGLLAAGECARTGVHGANRLASNSLLEGAVLGARAGVAAAEDAAAAAEAGDDGAGSDPAAAAAGAGGPVTWTRADLQQLMWSRAGLLRSGEQLREAAAVLEGWQAPAPRTINVLEDRNLLELGRLLVAAALARPRSVGAHHRLDDPGEAATVGPAGTSAAPASLHPLETR